MLKKINAWLHLWLGLASGIIVVILSITGCVLVFKQEIQSLSSPWLHAEKPEGAKVLAPSVLYKAVEKVLPEKEIHSVWYHGENKTAHFSLNSDSMVYVNPYTAEVVAMVDHDDIFHFMDEGHRHLWLPVKIGRPIIGWATFIFFGLLITGMVLWWPKKWNKKGREQSFKVKWKARFKRVNYDLHNVLGFYSLTLALLMAITGLIMSFTWFSKSVYFLTGGDTNKPRRQKMEVSAPSVNSPLYNADMIYKKVTEEIGQHNKDQVIVYFEEEADHPIYACTDMINGHWRDLYFDPATLELMKGSGKTMDELPFADKVRKLNYTLHVGAFGGMVSKTLYFLASLICASLPITGFYIWWGKKKKSTKKPKTDTNQNVIA